MTDSNKAKPKPADELPKSADPLTVFNPLAILAILTLWLAGGALVAYGWWSVSTFDKFIWAFGLTFWIFLSPLIVAFSLWAFSLALFFTGRMQLCYLVGTLATGIYRICEIPFNWANLALPSIVYEMHVATMIGIVRFADAEALAREILAKRERRFGKDSPSNCSILSMLAEVLRYENKFTEAETMMKRALQLEESKDFPFGIPHLYYCLGTLYHAGLKLEDAERALLKGIGEVSRLERKLSGSQYNPDQPEKIDSQTALFYSELGEVYSDLGKYDQADTCFQKAKCGLVNELVTMCWYRKVGELRLRQNRIEDAEPLVKDAVRLTDKYCKKLPTETIDTLKVNAMLQQAQGKLTEGEKTIKEAIALTTKVYGDQHPQMTEALWIYSSLLEQMGEKERAAETASQADLIKENVIKQFAVVNPFS